MKNQYIDFTIIPNSIISDKHLAANAKLLYGIISGLSQEKGYCWASNEYLGKRLGGIHKKSVSRLVSDLDSVGYITVEVTQKHDKYDRKISVV